MNAFMAKNINLKMKIILKIEFNYKINIIILNYHFVQIM